LAGDDRRASSVSFFEDFEEVVASGGIERFETPIIEDEQPLPRWQLLYLPRACRAGRGV
jgi:hypothetical protein